MGTAIDYTLGIGLETTYGIGMAPDRFFESEVKMKYTPVKVQGKGFQPTKSVNRLRRNTLSRIEVSGEQELEIPTKGFGILLRAVLGGVTSTVMKAAGTAYQHVFTPATTDPLPSFTMQGVVPKLGGSSAPLTFYGCMADGITIDAKEGEILTAKIDWTGKDMSTIEAAQAASFPVSDLFTFVHGSVLMGGLLISPTATALASSSVSTPVSNVAEFSLSIKNNLDKGGYTLGGAGKRVRRNELGPRSITGKLKFEYTDDVARDYFVNQTPFPLILTFVATSAGSIGQDAASVTAYPTLQIVLPSVLLKGDVPQSNGGAPVMIEADFEAFDNGTAAQPIWVILRSNDTAP